MPIGCLCQRISFSVSVGFFACPLPEAGAGVSIRSPVQAALPALFDRVSAFPYIRRADTCTSVYGRCLFGMCIGNNDIGKRRFACGKNH